MIEQIKTDLYQNLSHKPKRLKHIEGVIKTAKELGKQYHLDEEKIELAGYLHDFTKYYTYKENVNLITGFFQNAPQVLKEYNPNILHAFTAVVIAFTTYQINDPDVLGAIMNHTVGAPRMTNYEKVLFLADYIEPSRTYDSCVRVREIAKTNIDLAIYQALVDTISFHEKERIRIPKIAYEARDYYKQVTEDLHGKN